MYKLHHIDTCLPDYFSGHHLPVVQVIVDNKTTYGSLKNDLLYHYQSIDHLYDDFRFGDDGIDVDAYDKAVHDLFEGVQLDDQPAFVRYIDDYPNDDDCIDYVYAYFIIEILED